MLYGVSGDMLVVAVEEESAVTRASIGLTQFDHSLNYDDLAFGELRGLAVRADYLTAAEYFGAFIHHDGAVGADSELGALFLDNDFALLQGDGVLGGNRFAFRGEQQSVNHAHPRVFASEQDAVCGQDFIRAQLDVSIDSAAVSIDRGNRFARVQSNVVDDWNNLAIGAAEHSIGSEDLSFGKGTRRIRADFERSIGVDGDVVGEFGLLLQRYWQAGLQSPDLAVLVEEELGRILCDDIGTEAWGYRARQSDRKNRGGYLHKQVALEPLSGAAALSN